MNTHAPRASHSVLRGSVALLTAAATRPRFRSSAAAPSVPAAGAGACGMDRDVESKLNEAPWCSIFPPDGTCPVGYLIIKSNSTECLACPQHFFCNTSNLTLEHARIDRGYWRGSNTSDMAYLCGEQERCLGGGAGNAACTAHTQLTGIFCSLCPKGYHFVQGACTACTTSDKATEVVVVTLCFLAVLFAPLYSAALRMGWQLITEQQEARVDRASAGADGCALTHRCVGRLFRWLRYWIHQMRDISREMGLGNKLRICISHLQLVILLPSTYLLDTRRLAHDARADLIFTSEKIGWHLFDCQITAHRRIRYDLLVQTILPLLICAVWWLAGLYHGTRHGEQWVRWVRLRPPLWAEGRSSRLVGLHLPLVYNASATQMLRPIIALMYIIAPIVAHIAFDVIFSPCEELDGVRHLEAAPWVVCESAEHSDIRRFAWVQAAIYGLLVPLTFLALLLGECTYDGQ